MNFGETQTHSKRRESGGSELIEWTIQPVKADEQNQTGCPLRSGAIAGIRVNFHCHLLQVLYSLSR